MVWVDRSDGLLDAFVKGDEARVLAVGRFVEGVVARHPGVVLVVLRRRQRRCDSTPPVRSLVEGWYNTNSRETRWMIG